MAIGLSLVEAGWSRPGVTIGPRKFAWLFQPSERAFNEEALCESPDDRPERACRHGQ